MYKVPDMSTRKMDPASGEVWIGYSLKIVQHRLRQRLEAELVGAGVSAAQNAVLLAIGGNPRISNASLARAAFVTPQSMQAMLVGLERDGFIARTPHPQHGRIIMTELTDKGAAAAQAGITVAEAVERKMLSGLSEAEADLLGDLLKRCADALEVP
jgi:DNA-binding MarR family transcriptional regulator